jgi:hypothetical protein
MQEIACITVVVTNNNDEQVYKHFISATLAGEYIAFLPLFAFKRVELFPDKQDNNKVIK